MSFVIGNSDALATLAVGLWATRVGWRHPAVNAPIRLDSGEPVPRLERLIGPITILFAALELALGQS
jgi:hypothetical protein